MFVDPLCVQDDFQQQGGHELILRLSILDIYMAFRRRLPREVEK
jgi:hypothetical protein